MSVIEIGNSPEIENKIELTYAAILVVLNVLLKNECLFPVIKKIDSNINPKKHISMINNLMVLEDVKNHLFKISKSITIEQDGKCIIVDEDVVKKDLLELINKYGWDYDMSAEDFFTHIDKTAPLKYYPITDLKYAPLILIEYLRNECFIKDICLDLSKWNYNDLHYYNYNFSGTFVISIDAAAINRSNNVVPKAIKCKKQKSSKEKLNKDKFYKFLIKKAKQSPHLPIIYVEDIAQALQI